MNELAFKKKPQKIVKSYGLSEDAVDRLEELHLKHKVPRSQIIDELLMFGDTEIMNHTFIYAIKAETKGRPRFGGGKTYTDEKTKKYESQIKTALKTWWTDKALTGPIKCSIVFQIKEPKKPAKSYPSQKDLDNLIKAWLDGANGVIYKDDRQVVDLRATKVFGDDGRITFSFTEMEI